MSADDDYDISVASRLRMLMALTMWMFCDTEGWSRDEVRRQMAIAVDEAVIPDGPFRPGSDAVRDLNCRTRYSS